MRIVLWREKDAMRQCKISFGVIRRLFDGQKRTDLAALRSRLL